MHSLRRALTLLPAALLLALLAPSAGQAAGKPVVTIGIAEQLPDLFAQPLFRQLGAGSVRIVVPWDYRLQDKGFRAFIDDYLNRARIARAESLVVFAASPQKRRTPTVSRYRSEIKRFIRGHRSVKSYSAWNEPNLCGQGLCFNPKLAAAYAKALASACRRCNVLAADLVVAPPIKNKEIDAGLYARQMRRLGHLRAKIWGIHNYTDANRFQTKWTKKALKDMPGQIWFDEVAGMVHRPRHKGRIPNGYQYSANVRRSAKVLRYIFKRLVRVSSRVKRVYVYQWSAETPKNWDSGILDNKFRPRPAYRVIQKAINRARSRRGRLG